MNEFFRSIEKLATVKGVATMLVVLLLVIAIGRNLDFFSEITFKLDRSRASSGEKSSPTPVPVVAAIRDTSEEQGVFEPEVTQLQLAPVAFSLPAYFLIGVKNPGLSTGYIDMTVDFGAATVRAFEPRPRDAFQRVSGDTGSSVIKGRFTRVDPEETVYFYAHLSQPALARVLLKGSGSTLVLGSADANAAGVMERFVSPTMISFFRFVVAVVAAGLFIAIVVGIVNIPISIAEKWSKRKDSKT